MKYENTKKITKLKIFKINITIWFIMIANQNFLSFYLFIYQRIKQI